MPCSGATGQTCIRITTVFRAVVCAERTIPIASGGWIGLWSLVAEVAMKGRPCLSCRNIHGGHVALIFVSVQLCPGIWRCTIGSLELGPLLAASSLSFKGAFVNVLMYLLLLCCSRSLHLLLLAFWESAYKESSQKWSHTRLQLIMDIEQG